MSKLTEIKQYYEETLNILKDQPEFISTNFKHIGYLLSLLEEKDKALRIFADEKSWLLNDDDLIWDLSDGPMKIACKALNTSSNNEEETISTPTDKCPGCGEHLVPQWGGDEGPESYWEECQNPDCDYEEEQQ